MIIAERLEKLESLTLAHGGHSSFEQGVCAMEAVAWIAGEKHSDHPQCACPVIAGIIRAWNDSLPSDEERNRLIRPLVPRLVGTCAQGTPAEQDSVLLERMYMVHDWYQRVRTPAFLRLAGLTKEAEALEACPAIIDGAALEATCEAASAAESAARSAAESAARNAAWSAAESAARSAAESAAWSAAESAAWSAAESAARNAARNAAESAARSAAESAAESAARNAAESAARSAAESAARNAAWSAAWSAARNAAESALAPTVAKLQESFAELIARMCEVTE